MQSTARLRRGRELAVIAAGITAGAALLLAGATVHASLASAGDVAVARLSAVVADTVVAEWERMLRADEPPFAPARETFTWTTVSASVPSRPAWIGEGLEVSPVSPAATIVVERLPDNVAATLLDEAERRELVENDLDGALALVLEAFDKPGAEELLPALHLRALQLAVHLGRSDVVATHWNALRDAPLCSNCVAPDPIPERVAAWLSLPVDQRGATTVEALLSPVELEFLFSDEDRLDLGPPDDPQARFELAPILVVLLERLGLAPPALERRKFGALLRVAEPPMSNVPDGRWMPTELAGRHFLVHRDGERFRGFFYAENALQAALGSRANVPAEFSLDLRGDEEELGPAVRPRSVLPGSEHAFTLRHVDPSRIARAESSRLRLLRGALFALALACIGGGFLTARVLARERKLGELRSSFVAGVSHDLRTPLAAILLLAENLQAGVVGDADRARYHRALRKEATRLRRLVDEVLDFSRLERGEALRLQREEVALARFADELPADMRARVEDAGRSFAAEIGPLPATAAFDAFALRRAVENLVDNALKHGAGAVRLALAVDADRLLVRVTDEGAGVPLAERERVFEPFARLAGANGHVGGTGLGLAIVRAIARAHGGEARVSAESGTTFELELPLEEVGA